MATLRVVSAEDGKKITDELKTLICSTESTVAVSLVEDLLSIASSKDANEIFVVVLTHLNWNKIKTANLKKLKQHLFQCPEKVVILYCDTTDLEKADNYCAKEITGWSDVKKYNVTVKRDWNFAVAEIKSLLDESSTDDLNRVSKFLFKPDTIYTFDERHEVLIVVIQDDQEDVDYDTVVVGSEAQIEAKKIQRGVWSFLPSELKPGTHALEVYGNGQSLGIDNVTVVDNCKIATQALTTSLQMDPVTMLSYLLRINDYDFDSDLQLCLQGHSALDLLVHILKLGDPEGHVYPNFLHFCAKHGLPECTSWFKGTYKGTGQYLAEKNARGQTPLDVANTSDNVASRTVVERIVQTFQDTSSDSEEESLQSPLYRSGFMQKSAQLGTRAVNSAPPTPCISSTTVQSLRMSMLSDDSGVGTNSEFQSGGSQDRSPNVPWNLSATYTPGYTKPRSGTLPPNFQITPKRQHVYDSVEDEIFESNAVTKPQFNIKRIGKSKSDGYEPPWDTLRGIGNRKQFPLPVDGGMAHGTDVNQPLNRRTQLFDERVDVRTKTNKTDRMRRSKSEGGTDDNYRFSTKC